MTVRPCLASDLPVEGAPWLEPDAELEGAWSLVEEVGGRLVAAGLRPHGTPGSEVIVELWCEEGHGAEVLRALTALDAPRINIRVVPGTARAAAVAGLGGGEVQQSLPAAAVPAGHPDVQEWARARLGTAERAGLGVRPGTEYTLEELLDLWMGNYLRKHESWAPVSDVDAMRDFFRGWFTDRVDLEATFVAHADGRPVAATVVSGQEDGTPTPCMIEVLPDHPDVEDAAAASMAATLTSVGPEPVEFEGHVDETLYLRILETIPHRAAGRFTPMDIVRL